MLKTTIKKNDPNLLKLLEEKDQIKRVYYDEEKEILYISFWQHPNLLDYYKLNDVDDFFTEFWFQESFFAYWNSYYLNEKTYSLHY